MNVLFNIINNKKKGFKLWLCVCYFKNYWRWYGFNEEEFEVIGCYEKIDRL